MLTVDEIVAIAAAAASGGRKVVFRDLARAVGVDGHPGGWIYLPGGTKPVAHGWQAFAQLLSGSRVGFTGRDLLVEMSKASVSPADLTAAEREAHAMNVAPESAVRGHDQRRDFYREVSRRIVGPHSAQAERYAKRRLIAELHDEALDEDAQRAHDELPDCECHAMRAPHGGHLAACRRGEAIRRGIVTVDRESAAAHEAAMREYRERARAEPASERENRIAAAYTLFADLADSGGPATSRGLRAAVESASTVTEAQLVHVARSTIGKLNSIGLSTPVRVNPHVFASILAAELASLGFDVSE